MKRRDLSFGLDFGDMLRGIRGLLDTVQNVDEQGRSTIHKIGQFSSSNPSKIKVACNFNVKIGELKDSNLHSFRNLQAGAGEFENKRIKEPIVKVFDEEDYIVVISELPGIEENQIQLQIIDSCLKLCASGVQNYQATIPLPCPVDEKTIIYLYEKGTLEITVRKKRKLEGGQ